MMDSAVHKCSEDNDLPSDHTTSMRHAAQYCLSIVSSPDVDWTTIHSSLNSHKTQTEWMSVDSRRQRRTNVYNAFWQPTQSSTTTSTSNTMTASVRIPQLYHADISPRDFQRQFQHDNVPCLIEFVNNHENSSESSYFDYINEHWRIRRQGPQPGVNRDWFLHTLGTETLVPVRVQSRHEAASLTLDEDGRAMECVIQSIPLNEWVEHLKRAEEEALAEHEGGALPYDGPPMYYLKDWHLQLHLQVASSSCPDLYQCPPFFEYDLLNHFQRRFTNGDYRFCYWGPKGSLTSRHSDVLHSFSWSYNVSGTKQWTFFQEPNDCSGDEEGTMVVIQKSGQAIFVPSRWQHQVINLEETISVNHNWVTAANIDLCWDCLRAEMAAIDTELEAWGIHNNPEAQESMLRGCAGLDVTAFILMVVVRLCDLLVPWKDESAPEYLHLQEMLASVMEREESIDIKGRLVGVLQSKALASGLLKATDAILS